MTNDIQRNISLQPYNTFGVNVSCRQFVQVSEEDQLPRLFESGLLTKDFFVLGGGSNVLFTKDYDGLILQMSNKGISHFIEGNFIYITAKAGEVWNDFVWYCVSRGFAGVENMALIPGTVGASPIQNIGAYGTELMDIFYSCRAFDTTTGLFTTFNNEDCKFTYRDSIFKSTYKGRFIITSVTYKLHIHHRVNTSYGAINAELQKRGISSPSIRDVAETVAAIRVEKLPDPSTIGNAGSFFKNPIIEAKQLKELQREYPAIVFYPLEDNRVKLAAGWLIESCGWKGKVDGNVAVWKNQALVITNLGQASGTEIYTVSSKIMNDVYKKFGITLEREVNVL
ncbi:UDP-N-acetylmuramate dehydrogenase [Sphingobacterium allocomposti]|uniref:UDP-N-acetylenolpyruvoylglucosamine reductase n=1 Tax=Sphingobacterium allocomposti TaxID=415956 RepID=A0A5S5DMY6_9SPHI|nr:UDP-N-acetylmuramate dehydrogenase [Sphingobacterium composti Yoo et al. 2007 non Ten et al. 2007]TYP97313.1 UDP-N-acetylmuramate dehydrogenase [Sphingobacterium composti Yoo et al. 2007 non Ten et al. 2007]